jgi:SAM-dependent methyltransferase
VSVTVRKPERGPSDPPLFLREVIDAAPRGAHVLDAGCGPGSWPYVLRPDLDITGFDIKFPPGPPPRSERMRVARADLARLPFRDGSFDLTVCHYVLEHVTALEACCDELVRVTKTGGVLYLSVPRAASFDDRLYRFAGYFAKYVLMKFGKRIEHQQRFDLETLLARFERRGLTLAAHAFVPAGFSWMNDPRTKPLQGAFTDALAGLHRATGLDLAKDANFVLTFVKESPPAGGSAGGKSPAANRAALPGLRRVTHVCRDCGEHAIVTVEQPWPAHWDCPWCGRANPFGRPR